MFGRNTNPLPKGVGDLYWFTYEEGGKRVTFTTYWCASKKDAAKLALSYASGRGLKGMVATRMVPAEHCSVDAVELVGGWTKEANSGE